MVKVYNGSNTTFLLIAEDGERKKIPFKAFAEIEDKFQGDMTYRMAIASGALSVFETAKQGDAAEKTASKKNSGKPAREKSDGARGEDSAETTTDDKGNDAK